MLPAVLFSDLSAGRMPATLGQPSGAGCGRRERNQQLAACSIPNSQDAVLSASNDGFPVGRDDRGFDEIGGAREGTDFAGVFTDQTHLGVARSGQRLVGITDETDRSDLLVKARDVLGL